MHLSTARASNAVVIAKNSAERQCEVKGIPISVPLTGYPLNNYVIAAEDHCDSLFGLVIGQRMHLVVHAWKRKGLCLLIQFQRSHDRSFLDDRSLVWFHHNG
jgi:hypothetical protein